MDVLIDVKFLRKIIDHDMRSRNPILSKGEFEYLVDYLEELNNTDCLED